VWISIPRNNNKNPWKVSYQAYAFLVGIILRASMDIVVVLDLRCLLRQWKVCRCRVRLTVKTLVWFANMKKETRIVVARLYHRGRHHQSMTIAVFVYLLLWFFFPSRHRHRHWQKNLGIWRRLTQFRHFVFFFSFLFIP
jgi:hypothetical protein